MKAPPREACGLQETPATLSVVHGDLMQINSSPSLMIPTGRAPQRPAGIPMGKVPPGQPAPAPLGGPAQKPVDVAMILQHWGTSNADADLNTDGIVDAQDLALASAEQNTGVAGVQSSWGQSGTSDMNGDGTVDATDLALALHAQSQPAESRSAIVGSLVDAAFEARDQDGDGAMAAEDFADSGRIFKRLDLDASGRVGRDELTKALNAQFDRFSERYPDAQPSAFVKRWLEAFSGTRPAPNFAHFDRVQELFSRGAPTARGGHGILSARA